MLTNTAFLTWFFGQKTVFSLGFCPYSSFLLYDQKQMSTGISQSVNIRKDKEKSS